MPFVGIGLHLIVALFFAIHAVRTGQPIWWLFILFSFPLLGSIVYFVAIYLPNSRLQRTAGKVVAAAAKALDPTRELREAREAFEFTPTAQNQMRLAAALLEAGEAAEAARLCLRCVGTAQRATRPTRGAWRAQGTVCATVAVSAQQRRAGPGAAPCLALRLRSARGLSASHGRRAAQPGPCSARSPLMPRCRRRVKPPPPRP